MNCLCKTMILIQITLYLILRLPLKTFCSQIFEFSSTYSLPNYLYPISDPCIHSHMLFSLLLPFAFYLNSLSVFLPYFSTSVLLLSSRFQIPPSFSFLIFFLSQIFSTALKNVFRIFSLA